MPLESIYSENIKTNDTEYRSEDNAGSEAESDLNPFEAAPDLQIK